MAEYDIAGAAAGQAAQMQPEEREMARLRRIVNTAQETNYDGDPEYYMQIKSMAMQAGIPIKQFKTNPFRMAKTFGMSMLDTALMGAIPNDFYTPMNTAEEAANMGGAAAAFALPWGAAAGARKLAVGGIGALGKGSQSMLNKALGQGNFKTAKQAYKGWGKSGAPKSKPGTFMGGKPKVTTKGNKSGTVKPAKVYPKNKLGYLQEIRALTKASKSKLSKKMQDAVKLAGKDIKSISASELQKILQAARNLK